MEYLYIFKSYTLNTIINATLYVAFYCGQAKAPVQ